MKLLLPLVVISSMALTSVGAHAVDKDGRFAIKGVGVAKCSQFLNHLQTSKNIGEFGGWITGYLSAMNRMQAKTYDLAPWQDTQILTLGIASYCQKKPETQVHLAVAQLAKSLEPSRIKGYEKLIIVRQGEKLSLIYPSVLKSVQAKLKAKKYDVKPDGLYGKGTASALKAFQKSQKLEVTGLPDTMTIKRLMY